MTPGWWVLPLAGAVGFVCASFAQAYVALIERGAPLDAATCRRALWRALSRDGMRVLSGRRAALCVALMVLAALPLFHQFSLYRIAVLSACAILLVLSLIDARTRYLPDALTLPLLWAGLGVAWLGWGVTLHDAVAAAGLGYGLLRSTDAVFRRWRGRPGIGGGDMKLLAAIGAWTGWAPLPAVLLMACGSGVLYVLLHRGHRRRHAAFAFGPFLSLAAGFWLMQVPVVQSVFCLGIAACTRSV